MDKQMYVTFGHPTDSTRSLTVDITPDLTGEQAKVGLQTDYGQGAFLPPSRKDRNYMLAVERTGAEILDATHFGDLDLNPGEWINVHENVVGA
jgi:hypothetical protein